MDGVDVIVKNTLPGQVVSFILNKNKAGLKEGRLVEVLEDSPMEKEKGCSVCRKCGGCVYQTIPYEEELKLKDGMAYSILEKALKPYEDINLDEIYEGVTSSPEHAGYRNKMEFSFGNEVKDGPTTLGMHVSGHFMDVINTPDCNIVDADFSLIRDRILSYMMDRGLTFYNRRTGAGELRNLIVRKGINTGEILVDIVTTSGADIGKEDFIKALGGLDSEGEITGILHTVNDSKADAVIDEGTSVLYGRDYIFDELLGIRFRISVFSFFQTNTHGAEVLYRRVREYVEAAVGSDTGVVYDLYSGTGTIAQMMADIASHVYGIEIVSEAVESAKENARANKIDNAEFICGDVLKALDEVTEKPDLIILDPPRDGVNPKALAKILDYGVENIIYVSCKITSLARDLHPIIDAGYTPTRISVIDMFPKTANFETVCLIKRWR